MISDAKPLAKYFKIRTVNIYDTIFSLHSQCTPYILLIFTLMLSAKQYFGDPIQCMTDLKFKEFVHSYCWTIGTFLVPNAMQETRNSIAVGVGPNTIENLSLRYYQWVVIVLLLQAIVFNMPSFLWKRWEGKRLEQLCGPVVPALITPEKRKEHCDSLTIYFNSENRRTHKIYVIKYFTCELLNICISIINIIFLDYFLNGYWSRYFKTLSILSLNNWQLWNLHTSQIFPKLAKCSIYTFGLGGSINNNDALCMLPLNILNEKIFAFLWLWFIFITILAVLKIIYDIFLLFCTPLRTQLLRLRVLNISSYQIRVILKDRSFADWFILYKISLNVNPLFLSDLLVELHAKTNRNRQINYNRKINPNIFAV